MKVIRWAAAFDVILVIVGGVLPSLHGYMPIGGSHVAQLGVCLGLAFAYTELAPKKYTDDIQQGERNKEVE